MRCGFAPSVIPIPPCTWMLPCALAIAARSANRCDMKWGVGAVFIDCTGSVVDLRACYCRLNGHVGAKVLDGLKGPDRATKLLAQSRVVSVVDGSRPSPGISDPGSTRLATRPSQSPSARVASWPSKTRRRFPSGTASATLPPPPIQRAATADEIAAKGASQRPISMNTSVSVAWSKPTSGLVMPIQLISIMS